MVSNMTITTQTPPAAGLPQHLRGAVAALAQTLRACFTTDRLRQFDATFALTDAELAARGLKRHQLAASILGTSGLS